MGAEPALGGMKEVRALGTAIALFRVLYSPLPTDTLTAMNANHNRIALTIFLAITTTFLGCKGDTGDTGATGPPGAGGPGGATDNELHATEDGPGINISVLSIDGASGLDGTFQVGDTISMTFSVTKDDGSDWHLSEFSRGRTLVSGPTFNYQRIIPEKSDLATASVDNGDGTWTYTYATPIPATYLAPVNDTASFGPLDGELTGQSLLAGTYTVGMYFTWDYSVDEHSFSDVDNVTEDILFLGATTLQTREVVGQDNCNACHDSLRAHGGQRQDVTVCLLCHTSGSEDKNVGTAAGGTPGVSVDFKVMIHKIHNGAHLPSVNGIATNSDGSRNYAATPVPYEVVGYKNSIHDYSELEFPMWPNLAYRMPEDLGFSSLGSTEQGLENTQRGGVTSCVACHGDPDGAGPIAEPAQGMQAYQQPSRAACGSCHDDVHWDQPYNSNGQTMPLDMDDGTCLNCHAASGSPLVPPMLSNVEAHLHPMLNPALNPGLNFTLTSVDEAGTNDGDDTIDVGEKVSVTFSMTDGTGADVNPALAWPLGGGISAVLSGPTSNLNLVLNGSIPTEALGSTQSSYTLNLPDAQYLERLGLGAAGLDTFTTDFTPLWDDIGAPSTVYVRGAAGASSTLAGNVPANSNFIDVADGSLFAKDDYIVIADGTMGEEYLKVQWVDDDRLWFGSAYQTDYKPGTVMAHAMGDDVKPVTLVELTEGTEYEILDVATGSYRELIDGGAGAIYLVSYTSDFVMPANYPLTFNASPDVDEAWGKWTGKPIVDGTYRLGLWGDYSFNVNLFAEDNSYPNTSLAGLSEFLVGDASTIVSYDLIEEAESCYACHDDIYFHGGHRRGVDACIQCHGAAGGEDRPQYRAPGAGETAKTMIKFREMVHRIHQGANLDKADTYTVNGYGSPGNYPNNFSAHQYDEVVFPTFPGGTKHCQKCHGDSNAWQSPHDLSHPTSSLLPSRSWRSACGSCHDSDPAHAHIDAQTSPSGAESCVICHDDGSAIDVEYVHNPRM